MAPTLYNLSSLQLKYNSEPINNLSSNGFILGGCFMCLEIENPSLLISFNPLPVLQAIEVTMVQNNWVIKMVPGDN